METSSPSTRMISTEDIDFESLFQFQFDGEQTSDQGQVPTPPRSPPDHHPMAGYSGQNTEVTISVSTRFFPGARLTKEPEDLTLQSADSVFFYVSSAMILGHSENRFGSHIPPNLQRGQMIYIPESSEVLNIILHALYEISLAENSPPLPALITAVKKLTEYGLDAQLLVRASKPLHTALLSYSPLYPIEIYALAASLELEELAVPTSSHLLSFRLSNLTDEMASRIGSVYLNRLVKLHIFRTEELKAMLLVPPHPHPEMPNCDFAEQRKLSRAWSLAAAYLAWDARPDMSTETISTTFRSLGDDLTCANCKEGLAKRVKEVVVKWSLLRLTI